MAMMTMMMMMIAISIAVTCHDRKGSAGSGEEVKDHAMQQRGPGCDCMAQGEGRTVIYRLTD